MGIGGTPEGIITGVPLAHGRQIQCLWPIDDAEAGRAREAATINRVLGINDLVSSDNCFFAATGDQRRHAPWCLLPCQRCDDLLPGHAFQVGTVVS